MKKIAIVTDSTCDLPDALLEKYEIKILPLRIIYSNKEFRDRIEISGKEVYEKLDHEIPKTSLPSPEDVHNLFKKLQEQRYTHVLAILISGALSGTYNMVKNFSDKFNELKIELLDSKSLTMGLGFPVLEAARELRKTNDFSKICERAKEAMSKSKVFYVLKTLDYLRRGGRIGVLEGTVGEILGIKPIISIDQEGKYYAYAKVRGRKKSIEQLYEIIKEKSKDKKVNVAVMHGDAEEEARDLLKRIKEFRNVDETFFGPISPVLGIHTGPGLIGLITYEVIEE
ncbi:DegV family protein [Marinisporobacter balticus]|uniref:DegV family protein with EDD domain n=1 Tax=Marinisporobacter balticus TaxID=2018667 RepID=A0A4V2SAF4_9FIRM|nr:DegV family protein [Marinisporobacter balticus]TCO71470.1 DegV family protein with EDD domain [Marinisporobacter balticus]